MVNNESNPDIIEPLIKIWRKEKIRSAKEYMDFLENKWKIKDK